MTPEIPVNPFSIKKAKRTTPPVHEGWYGVEYEGPVPAGVEVPPDKYTKKGMMKDFAILYLVPGDVALMVSLVNGQKFRYDPERIPFTTFYGPLTI